jgi:hypothetical protein
MKTKTLLLLAGGGALGYYLYKQHNTAAAVAPAAAPAATPPAAPLNPAKALTDFVSGMFSSFSDALKKGSGTSGQVINDQTPMVIPIMPPKTNSLSGTSLDGNVLASRKGMGSLG